MEVMVILIGFSLIVALGFLGAFFWAVRSGQFDDSVTPSYRVLFDDPSDHRRDSTRQQEAPTSAREKSQSTHLSNQQHTTTNQTNRDH
jgi:cbb3-type cytochrome oxidase maturation protein